MTKPANLPAVAGPEALPAKLPLKGQRGYRTPKDKDLPRIFSLMHTGLSLSKACKKLGFDTGDSWRVIHKDPTGKRKAEYQQAQELSAQQGFDKLGDIADAVITKKLAPDVGRVSAGIIQWRLARQAPHLFGDKITQELTGPGGAPLQAAQQAVVIVIEDNGRPRTINHNH